jgi:hypothetical protein
MNRFFVFVRCRMHVGAVLIVHAANSGVISRMAKLLMRREKICPTALARKMLLQEYWKKPRSFPDEPSARPPRLRFSGL